MEAKFLDEEENTEVASLGAFKITLASYPRCGNSLLRNMLEKVSKVVTGTDSRPDRSLIQQLTAMGFKGEGVLNEKVLFVKTHYPERLGYKPFSADGAIVLMRNPFDAILSYFNMVLTQTHTNSIEDSEYSKYDTIWKDFVAEEATIFFKFYEQWVSFQTNENFNVKTIKFEDLVQNRAKILTELNEFMTETFKRMEASPEVIQTFSRRMLENIAKLEAQPTLLEGKYKPRAFGKTSKDQSVNTQMSRFYHSLKRYDASQISFVLVITRPFLVKFGYWDELVELGVAPKLDAFTVNSRCLYLSSDKDEQSEKTPNKLRMKINTRYALRPRTDDDPHGRGFGTRWKKVVAQFPPVQREGLDELDFSTLP